MALGMTCGEFCRLFCCPPCPSSIAAKLAFLPPEKTYTMTHDDAGQCSLHLSERAEFQFTQLELDKIEAMMVKTQKGNTIACMYVKVEESPKYTLLFSHGNAVDLGQMSSFYVGLGRRLKCNVFAYDYSGYGESTGSPTEGNIYADAQAAWTLMTGKLNIDPSKIIIYGQSIGTAASVDLATRHSCAGIVLHSPLMSGMRVVFPNVQRTYFFDPFQSVVKIRRVQTVVLVIHGTEDEVIDFSHGLCIYERAPNTVDPLWIEGAGHNDVEQYRSYLVRLQKFVDKELPARAAAAAAQAAQREAEAAAAEAVAVASRQASGEDVAHAAVGDDGVMVLSGQFEDDETESANDRDVADGSVKKSSRTPSPRPSSVAGSFGKLDADKAIPSNASQTSALPIDTASDDVLEGKSTEELLPVNPSPMSSTDRHTPAKNSSMSRSEDDQSTASTTQQAARTASQTSLPLSSDLASTPLPDEQEVADMTVVTRDGGRKTLASLAPTESLTLVYV